MEYVSTASTLYKRTWKIEECSICGSKRFCEYLETSRSNEWFKYGAGKFGVKIEDCKTETAINIIES